MGPSSKHRIFRGQVDLVISRPKELDSKVTFPNACWYLGSTRAPEFPSNYRCSYCSHNPVDFSFELPPDFLAAQDVNTSLEVSDGIQFRGPSERQGDEISCRLLWSDLCKRHASQPFEHCLQGREIKFYDDNSFNLDDRHPSRSMISGYRNVVPLEIVIHPALYEEWQSFVSKIFYAEARMGVRAKPSRDLNLPISSLKRTQDSPEPEQRLNETFKAATLEDSTECDSSSEIEISVLSHWLNECKSHPGTQRTVSEPSDLSTFDMHEGVFIASRVIDITAGCLVTAPSRCRYVALSYVWGNYSPFRKLVQEESRDLHWPGGISLDDLEMPRAIKDALWLCSELGERYLWVDALCIMQDNQSKHNELKGMESIFRGAALTIVAASGTNANSGLRGVRIGSSFVEQDAYLRENYSSQQFEESVDSSVWNRRAWTYQERLLSQRLVFFTAAGIFLQCEHGKFRLDPSANICASCSQSEHESGTDDHYKFHINEMVNFTTYARVVAEYSKRQLSYDEDILNAFNGLEKLLDILFCGETNLCTEAVFGMPIPALDIALLWYPLEHLEPRYHFPGLGKGPSWSWSGWIGPVYYPDVKNISERTRSCVQWSDPFHPDESLPGKWFGSPKRTWNADVNWQRNISLGGDVYYVKKALSSQRWFSNPVSYRFIHDPIPVNREKGLLYLVADVSEFRIASMFFFEHVLSINDGNGFRAGTVTMDRMAGRGFRFQQAKFVKLSQTTLYDNEDDPAWDNKTQNFSGRPGQTAINPQPARTDEALRFDERKYDKNINWCLYNVLLVIENSDGTVSRAGIGKIHIHAFDAISKKDVQVVLC